MLKNWQQFVLAGLMALFLAGCDGTMYSKEDESAAPAGGAASTSPVDASSSGVGTGTGFQGDPLDDPASPLSKRTVYFAYDNVNVVDQDRIVVEAHAQYLAENPASAVTLEGHADERGSREYNVALGERRASSVRQLMSLLGASGAQIRMVSYGEERPAFDEHDDESWGLNRRVEIIYRNR
jgi:peptidoglycan-associated lipoprotein